MSIEISKIGNEKNRAIAYQVDDGDGYLNEQEQNIWMQEIEKNNNSVAQNMDVVVKTSKTKKDEGANPVVVSDTKASSVVTAGGTNAHHVYNKLQMDKLVNETIPNKLREYAGQGLTPQQLISKLEEQYKGNAQLAPIINEIKDAYAYMVYSNKSDVQKVFKGYKFNTKNYSIEEAIRQSGIQAAKNDLIMRDVANLSIKCKELEEANPTLNKKQVLEKLKQNLDSGSYPEISYKNVSYNKFRKEFEKTIKDMRLMNDKEIEVLAKTDSTDVKTVRNQYQAEIGYKTDVKTAKVMKYKNLAEQRKTELSDISYNNLKKLEGYNDVLWNKLKGKFLQQAGVYNPEKNTYNLTDLYTVFDKYVGSDATINFSQDKQNAENHKILKDLKELISDDITMTDAKDLARLCGYGIDARDRSITNYSASDAPDALSGIVTGILTSVDINMTQVQGEFVKDFTESELKELMGLGYKLTEFQGKQILVDPQNVQVLHLNTLLKNLLVGGATTLALSLIGHFVIGEPRAFEAACISLNDQLNQDFNSVDELKQYVTENYGAQKAKAIEVIAKQFVKEDGSFDNAGFKNALASIAGAFSNLNCYEVAGARVDAARGNVPINTVTSDKTDGVHAAQGIKSVDPEYKAELSKEKDKTNNKITERWERERQAGDSWTGYMAAFYPTLFETCLDKNGHIDYAKLKQARIQMQKAIWTDKDGNFNREKYIEMINADNVPALVRWPLKVGEHELVRGNVNKGYFVQGTVGDSYNNGQDVSGYKIDAEVKQTITGDWIAKDLDNGTTASGESKKKALENLEKTNNGRQYANKDDLLKEELLKEE
ncbi:MAG: hypothetical protein MJ231_08335 [bacterium]|nr:hypothetical protein [bacterium]